jgi:hypothetical protein
MGCTASPGRSPMPLAGCSSAVPHGSPPSRSRRGRASSACCMRTACRRRSAPTWRPVCHSRLLWPQPALGVVDHTRYPPAPHRTRTAGAQRGARAPAPHPTSGSHATTGAPPECPAGALRSLLPRLPYRAPARGMPLPDTGLALPPLSASDAHAAARPGFPRSLAGTPPEPGRNVPPPHPPTLHQRYAPAGG